MTTQELQGYIQIATIIASLGKQVVGQMRQVIDLFHPGHELTEEQINAIEQAAIADSERRRLERLAMAGASDATR